MKKIAFTFLFMLIFSLTYSFFSIETIEGASTITVDDSGGMNYTKIQDAIDNANSGDTIIVYSGKYTENIVIDKSIYLEGESKDNTVISGETDGHVVEITADNVEINGFTIQNPVGPDMKCVKLNNVENCVISDNLIRNGNDGVFVVTSDNNNIKDNVIEGNDANGIYLQYSNNNEIKNNIIRYNDVYGIRLYYSNSNLLYKNDFSDNINNNARDDGNNKWNTSTQGNYWDDYNDYDNNHDDIGDNPYSISGGSNYDYKPLGDFITQHPTAYITGISPNPAEEGQTINFYGMGTPQGEIIDWEWKISGNIMSNSEDFSYSGLSKGTYSVYFKVKNSDGIWSEYDHETLIVNEETDDEPQINQKPTAHIQTIKVDGTSCYFKGYGEDDDGIVVMYNWSSDIDGFLSDKASFTKIDLTEGTHTITFKVRDNKNLWSLAKITTIKIEEKSPEDNNIPVAIIKCDDTGYVNKSVTFDASDSYDINGTITSYIWDFGDGNTSSEITVEHNFSKKGEYTIVLTVTDNLNQESSTNKIINILDQSEEENDNENNKWVIPGFEISILIITLTLLFIAIKYYKK